MYEMFLAIHNLLRWLVVIAGIWLIFLNATGLRSGRPWSAREQGLRIAFTAGLDLQFLVGLLLYGVFSPLTTMAMHNYAAAMQNPELRFFAVEHPTLMVAALVLAHVGGVKVKREADLMTRQRKSMLWYTASLAAILLAIPWWRPLFRL